MPNSFGKIAFIIKKKAGITGISAYNIATICLVNSADRFEATLTYFRKSIGESSFTATSESERKTMNGSL